MPFTAITPSNASAIDHPVTCSCTIVQKNCAMQSKVTTTSVGVREIRLTAIAQNGAPNATTEAAANQFAKTSGAM
jgi:hypothetical protein